MFQATAGSQLWSCVWLSYCNHTHHEPRKGHKRLTNLLPEGQLPGRLVCF